jgi:hypothetical protein
MKLYIRASTNKTLQANQIVNRVAKYLYKNTRGAFKFVKTSNSADVWVELFGYSETETAGSMQRLIVNISVTTYKNCIRVNTIDMSPSPEKTLGHKRFPPEDFLNLETGKRLVLDNVEKHIRKEYTDYMLFCKDGPLDAHEFDFEKFLTAPLFY